MQWKLKTALRFFLDSHSNPRENIIFLTSKTTRRAMCEHMLIAGETFSFKQTNNTVLIAPFINCSPNQIARFLRSWIFDPGPVYKRTTLFWVTHISLISHQPHQAFKNSSRHLWSAFFANDKFDPVKKVSSAMVASAGNTVPARQAYPSPLTEAQLKPVLRSTGSVLPVTSLRLKVRQSYSANRTYLILKLTQLQILPSTSLL